MEIFSRYHWYGVAILAVPAILLLRPWCSNVAAWAHRQCRHRVLIHRSRWSSLTITIANAMVIFTLIGVNTLLVIVSRKSLPYLAVINIVPLFLGGRTNIEMDFLGISLPLYQITHNWLGRIVVVEGILHVGFGFRSHQLGPSKIAGILAASLLVIIMCLSLTPARRWMTAFAFGFSHLILSLVTLVAIFLHVMLITTSFVSFPSVLCMIAGALFIISACLRLIRKTYRGKSTVIDKVDHATVWVRLNHSVQTLPGAYFYMRFPDLPLRLRFHSILVPVAFWRAENRGSSKEIAFIIPSPQSSALENISIDGPYGGIHPGLYDLVILLAEGPGIAGVLSVALSILSRRMQDKEDKASGTSQPKLYCDKTRKIDLIWKLEYNKQVEQASSLLHELCTMEDPLREKDTGQQGQYRRRPASLLEDGSIDDGKGSSLGGSQKPLSAAESERSRKPGKRSQPPHQGGRRRTSKAILMVWIIYPEPLDNETLHGTRVPKRPEFQELHKSPKEYPELLASLIRRESSRTPGESILVACGSGPFCRLARAAVRDGSSSMTFKEMDYQPPSPCSDKFNRMETTQDFNGVHALSRPQEAVSKHSSKRRGKLWTQYRGGRARSRQSLTSTQKQRSQYRVSHVRASMSRVIKKHRDMAASSLTGSGLHPRYKTQDSAKGLSLTLND